MATNNDHYNNGVVYRTPEGQLYDTSDQTYLMSPLQDVVVEATASPETKNKMQLGYNKKWQDWHKQYQKWWDNYGAAKLKAEQSDMNNYVRKGINDFAQDYVFPAMTTALTAGFTSGGVSLLPRAATKAATAADVLWNPATTITSRFTNPLVRGAGKAVDVVGIHLPVYRETAADIVSKASGEKNWFTDQQGNFDPFTTAETVLAPFIGAGAVKEGKEIYNFAKTLPTEVELYRILRNPKIPADYNTPVPQKIRTRLGDIEINDPNLAYRQGENIAEDFLKTKTVRTPDEPNYNNRKVTLTSGKTLQLGKSFENPMFSQGHLWYGVPTSPYSELLVTAEPLSVAGKSSRRFSSEANGTLDIRNYRGNNSGTRRVPMDSEQLSPLNTSVYRWDPNYGYRKLREEPSTSLKFFERKPARISEAERAGIPKGDRKIRQGYSLKDAIEEANKFAEKWGYNKLPQNATLQDIENLYNQHNTFFRGVTTELMENSRNRIAKELGINPEQLTNDQYLQYVSTHSWPEADRIWVTPIPQYGKLYGNSGMIGGQLSAVMRPWKTTKDIKQWPKLSQWTLGFREDISNPVITPWVSKAPDAIRALGAQSEFLAKSPLIYRGPGDNFKGTLQQHLKYKDGQGRLGWIESQVGELPQEIIIEKRGGTIKQFKSGGTIPVSKVAKTAFKVFKGDHLKLMKQRLKNGGFERLAKTAKEDEAIKPSPGGMGEYKQNLLTKSKDWLLAQEPMKVSSKELEEYKRKHGFPKPVTSPKSGASSQFGKYYTDLYTDAPEKLKAIPNDKHQIAAHEYSHFVYKPSTTAPGFNYDKFPAAGQYFRGKNGSSELAARGSQLKNYFGLNKGSDDITPEMLTYAKEHYVKDTGIDNNMTSMFESVEDSNKFSNWISKNAPLIPLELAMKSIVLRNQPDPLSAKKGSKIAKHSWSANFGHTVDGNPNLDNMKNDYVTKKKKKHA